MTVADQEEVQRAAPCASAAPRQREGATISDLRPPRNGC